MELAVLMVFGLIFILGMYLCAERRDEAGFMGFAGGLIALLLLGLGSMALAKDPDWHFLVITWYGELPGTVEEAAQFCSENDHPACPVPVSVAFEYESECREARARIEGHLVSREDPLFGYVITECGAVE